MGDLKGLVIKLLLVLLQVWGCAFVKEVKGRNELSMHSINSLQCISLVYQKTPYFLEYYQLVQEQIVTVGEKTGTKERTRKGYGDVRNWLELIICFDLTHHSL